MFQFFPFGAKKFRERGTGNSNDDSLLASGHGKKKVEELGFKDRSKEQINCMLLLN
jgi:hypothetical protein